MINTCITLTTKIRSPWTMYSNWQLLRMSYNQKKKRRRKNSLILIAVNQRKKIKRLWGTRKRERRRQRE